MRPTALLGVGVNLGIGTERRVSKSPGQVGPSRGAGFSFGGAAVTPLRPHGPREIYGWVGRLDLFMLDSPNLLRLRGVSIVFLRDPALESLKWGR